MAAFTIYLDESGSPNDTEAVVVAGFIAETAQWIEFERNWNEVLSRFGVSGLHMRHFAHSNSEFAGWKGDETKRRDFLSRLISVIRTRVTHSFASAVMMEDYHKVDRTYFISEIFKPYTIAGRTCVSKVRSWAERRGINPLEISYFFEDGAADKTDLKYRLNQDQISNCHFIPKEASVALQSADLLAYEHLLANTKIAKGELVFVNQLRHPMKELGKIPNGPDGQDWGFYSEQNLVDLCVNTKIPKRPLTA
jgi:hypothetical protein